MKAKMLWAVEQPPRGEKWPQNVPNLVIHKGKAGCEAQVAWVGEGVVRAVRVFS